MAAAHFYGRPRIFMARARIFAAGIDTAADKATGLVVSGPTTAPGTKKVAPPDAARWHRPRPRNPGTRLDTRSFFSVVIKIKTTVVFHRGSTLYEGTQYY